MLYDACVVIYICIRNIYRYAVTVKMKGGGPGYTKKKEVGTHVADRDHIVAAASMVWSRTRLHIYIITIYKLVGFSY
jgi:hypothetical protein